KLYLGIERLGIDRQGALPVPSFETGPKIVAFLKVLAHGPGRVRRNKGLCEIDKRLIVLRLVAIPPIREIALHWRQIFGRHGNAPVCRGQSRIASLWSICAERQDIWAAN